MVILSHSYPEEKVKAVSSLSGTFKVFRSLFINLELDFGRSTFAAVLMFSGSVDNCERFCGLTLSTPFACMLCQTCPGVVDI